MDKIVGETMLFNLSMATSLGEGKPWIQTSKNSLENWPCVVSFSEILINTYMTTAAPQIIEKFSLIKWKFYVTEDVKKKPS